MNPWESLEKAKRLRQWAELQRIATKVSGDSAYLGLILIGSFASGTCDSLSDIDLIVAVRDGMFDEAWRRRETLREAPVAAAWDERKEQFTEAGSHKWVTHEVIFVECFLATPTSGVQVADPAHVIVGEQALLDRFPRRGPIDRSEMQGEPHPVERAYDDLKALLRKSSDGTHRNN